MPKGGSSYKPKLKKSPNEDTKCAPARKHDGLSCSTEEELKDMANAWNRYVEMKMIDKKPINLYNDKRGLLEQ